MSIARQTWVIPTFAGCALLVIGGLAALSGCGTSKTGEAATPPPPPVTVAHPVAAPITDYRDFSGVTEAVETVQIRARVQGFLEQIHFTEGTEVKEGDLLYTIDPRTYQAELARAEAELTRLQAQLALAENEEARSARLRRTSAVTEEEYVQRVATRQQAQASVEEAKAAIEVAKINLSYTEIRAPISGRVGRTLLTVGNLVGYNEPTLLTTIVRLDPIYVVFEGTERGYLNYERSLRERGAPGEEPTVPVFVNLEGEQGYPHRGLINFRENSVDPGTGTIQLRATIPNPDRIVVPGLFAQVRVPLGGPKQQLLVPQTAIGADQRGSFVTIIGENNIAKTKTVQTGLTVGELIIIREGLTTEDLVVVNGTQKARPGAPVTPELTQLSPPPADELRAAAETAAENAATSEAAPAESTATPR